MSVADLARGMGEMPDYSGGSGANGISSYWSRVEETAGKRSFFSEVTDVIAWLEGKRVFVGETLATGGTVEVIVQLPGDRNIGDSWTAKDMARAASLGVSLGVEVFPSIRGVTSET